ncbi:MAG: DUF448 domain-containing protein [Magnetococcales bacterium]|nr:DUF448 domain-containing protein [Magnetococcales bacterium]
MRRDDTEVTAGESSPVRSCVVTRVTRDRGRLLRFVVDPMGRLMEDLPGRCPGRSVYVQPRPEHIVTLLKRRSLLRSWGQRSLSLPDEGELLGRLAKGLSRRLLDGIGLACRAKQAWVGVEQLTALSQQANQPLLVLLAADTADHTREKAMRLLRHFPHAQCLRVLDREQLGAALGGNLIAVVSITGEPFVRRVATDAARWLTFNGLDSGD